MTESNDTDFPSSGAIPIPVATEPAAERITTRPPLSAGVALRNVPPPAGLPSEFDTIALVGKLVSDVGELSIDLRIFHEKATADRAEAKSDRADGRAWYAKQAARHAQDMGVIRGEIQTINRRLIEGDELFRDLRGELEQTRADRADDRDKIAKLTDCIQGLSLQVQLAGVATAVAASHRELAGLVLLVLEDTEQVRTMVSQVCESYGARVLQASTIAEARQLVDGPSPPLDVVLVDLRIGNEDAMPFVRDLVERGSFGVMILSGHLDDAQVEEAQALNVTCLTKPFDIPALTSAIRRAANRHP